MLKGRNKHKKSLLKDSQIFLWVQRKLLPTHIEGKMTLTILMHDEGN